jgi:hypothetical protein
VDAFADQLTSTAKSPVAELLFAFLGRLVMNLRHRLLPGRQNLADDRPNELVFLLVYASAGVRQPKRERR